MKLAVMQPYLFPYIGYYQLAFASDFFIFYDDVTYIKNGYINRNSILTKNGKQLFTLPVNNASSFTLIKDLNFSNDVKKIIASIKQTYSKAPFFNEIFPIIESVFNSENRNVSYMASKSIIEIFKYLNIDFEYTYSSLIDYDRSQNAANKLYQFCNKLSADEYINTIGGQSLYDKTEFKKKNINLSFISCGDIIYHQFNNKFEFEKKLSIIDLLMNENKEKISDFLKVFNLV